MALPLKYNFQNVIVRWRSTLAAIFGIGLVVAVYVMLQALAVGLERNSANTGDERNYLIVRKGATSESVSQVTREQFRYLQYMEEIAKDEQGKAVVTADTMVLVNLPRLGGNGEANVLVRGVMEKGKELRPQVQLVEGRWFVPGKREVVVSKKLAARFKNFQIGEAFHVPGADLKVVGWLDGGRSAFDSEVWMDTDEARNIFGRENYTSVLVRPIDEAAAAKLKAKLESSKQIAARMERETEYYRKQTKTAGPIKFLGVALATIMSVGAVFSAMNTMYATVGARTREVGTLRVLGFHRRAILFSFLMEGAILAFLGGVLGCLIVSAAYAWVTATGYTIGTINFDTFSEVIFDFRPTPELMGQGLVFAVVIGLLGSLLPAWRASRIPVISALKSV
jgi:putative ABC transport system permease protein